MTHSFCISRGICYPLVRAKGADGSRQRHRRVAPSVSRFHSSESALSHLTCDGVSLPEADPSGRDRLPYLSGVYPR